MAVKVREGTPEPSNVAAVFGTSSRASAALWALLSGTNLILLVLDPVDGIPLPGAWGTWMLLAIAAGAVFFPRGDPLAPQWMWTAGVLCVLAGAAVFWDPPSEASGYAPWYVRSVTIVLVVLLLRRRPAIAWGAGALAVAAVLTWAALSGEDVGRWVGLLARQLATLVVVQVTAIGLAWAARTIAAYRAEEHDRVRSEELRSASIRERRAELASIRALAAPLLIRIARGDDDAGLRVDALVGEAALRDVLRARRLALEPLTTAAHEARQRGVEVILLDDLGETGALGADGEPDDARRDEALRWVAERIRVTARGTVTVRLSRGVDGPVLTALTGDDEIATRLL
jgi:hypothetical protein